MIEIGYNFLKKDLNKIKNSNIQLLIYVKIELKRFKL